MSVKVGLETSSGCAAPSPFTMPFAKVVLPAPRLPINNTATLAGNSAARLSPSAIVSSSDCVRMVRDFTHGLRQVLKQIRSNQRFFTKLRRAQFAASPMQINRREKRGINLIGKLRHQSRDQSRQYVARASSRHRRRTSGINPNPAIRRGNYTPVTLQYQVHVAFSCKRSS